MKSTAVHIEPGNSLAHSLQVFAFRGFNATLDDRVVAHRHRAAAGLAEPRPPSSAPPAPRSAPAFAAAFMFVRMSAPP